MTMEIRLREEAEADLNEAAIWYQEQQRGLGYDFLDEIRDLLQSIQLQPLAYPIVHRNTHRALTNKFPFGIFYRIEAKFIVVLAIMHASRHPHRWKNRT